MRPYRLFLSMNFSDKFQFVLDAVKSVAAECGFDIASCPPGESASSPAEAVLGILQDVDAMLVIMERSTPWLNNEVGMAFALGVPIFVIAKRARELVAYRPS